MSQDLGNVLKFNKTQHNRVFEDVIQQVEEAIIGGELKPGDRLPSERELQKMLDVGRGTLRESLRVLEQKGLIEIKTGAKGGIYVKKLTAEQMRENLALLVRLKKVSLQHLAQFREDVEGLVAARAAMMAVQTDSTDLEELLDQLNELGRSGLARWSEFMEMDKKIHLTLADVAGNPIHHYFLEVVHESVRRYNIDHYLPRKPETIESILQDLKCLVEAVIEGDADRAQTIARNHVWNFNEIMEKAAKKKFGILKTLNEKTGIADLSEKLGDKDALFE